MRPVFWIAATCLGSALFGATGSSCLGQETAQDSAPGGAVPPAEATSDLAWDLTCEMDTGPPELAQIQELLYPRDPEINPQEPAPDFEQAEQVCLRWLRRTDSSDAKVLLAAIHFQQGDSVAALVALTEVIVQEPSNWKALWIRSQILNAGGQFAEARADAARMIEHLPDSELDQFEEVEPGFLFELFETPLDFRSDPDVLIPAVALHFIVYFLVCLRSGRRQRREAGGTLRRLLTASLFVASLWSLPVLAAAVLIHTDTGFPPGLFWWVLMEVFAFFLIRSMMNPPNLSYVGRDPLPQCNDSEMLERVKSLSEQIGVAPPTVRSQRALNATTDSAAAFVGGLAPHSIVLYDTVLAQLKKDEQDAIIGHELGHIANRSIWVYVTLYPLAATAMTVLSFLGGGYFGVIAGMALYVGIFRAFSRHFEYDCDRRSALVTSPDAMARGLRRIYARHPLGKPGLLTSIVHSTASHPSLDERIHVLSELAESGEAGPDQSVTVPYRRERVFLCRRLVWFFAFAWFGLTTFGIAGRLLDFGSQFSIYAVHLAAFGPLAFGVIAMRRPARIHALRAKGKVRWNKFSTRQQIALFAGLLLAALVAVAAAAPDLILPQDESGRSPLAGVVFAFVLLVLVLLILSAGLSKAKPRHYPKLILEMTAAFQRNDFQKVLDLCEENRRHVDKDRYLLQNEAAALLGIGDIDRCVECFEKIHEDHPFFPPAVIALATLLIDQGNPQRALELIRDIETDLHKLDPMPPLLAARALRELGQVEDAWAECERAANLAPDDLSVMGLRASLALDRGDREEADQIIDLATSLLPAEPLLIVARGERAILDGDMASLRKEHDALRTSLEDDRLLSLHRPLAKLAAALPPEPQESVPDEPEVSSS